MDKLTFDLDIDFPLLRIDAQYSISGKLLMMPIKGEGPVQSNVTDCKSKSFLQGELYEKDGETYMKFTNMTLKVNVGNGVVKIQNLFNGDKILNDVVNDAINKNLGLFTQEMMPYVENALSGAILDIANKIVGSFTFKQLFPH
ncbi:hypothetical protein ILUMI_15722 [Ignelater luminosus]|uniref:Uncharacterized protein n=1 Tax=Ignelater luminosus TaxID=2038154 RepID=A0A8K0CRP9_IGNLU|nr:hypothetical protein ILUMI_18837 [Ignelater luminosus]KAF2890451.1 hypothetical protein ILUMI_15722 [Ignelater luminosus]